MAYQRKTLVPLANVGAPGDLPPELVGLADVSLADLPVAIGVPAATQLGYLNTGFFPVADPVVNPQVTNAAMRVAIRRAGHAVAFQNAVNALPPEFAIWYDRAPYFALGDVFLTAVAAQAGGLIAAQMAAMVAVAATAQPA